MRRFSGITNAAEKVRQNPRFIFGGHLAFSCKLLTGIPYYGIII